MCVWIIGSARSVQCQDVDQQVRSALLSERGLQPETPHSLPAGCSFFTCSCYLGALGIQGLLFIAIVVGVNELAAACLLAMTAAAAEG